MDVAILLMPLIFLNGKKYARGYYCSKCDRFYPVIDANRPMCPVCGTKLRQRPRHINNKWREK
jgi:rRNA maturation endonuclease Nob1